MADGNSVIQALEIGLKQAAIRGKVVANNLANVDTPGFRRRAVMFEQRLADALASGRDVDLDGLKPKLIRPLNTPVESNGNDVNVDMEVGEMIKNGAHYKTYMRVMAKMYGQMERAIQTQ